VSNAPSKPVSFSRPKVGYFSNRPRIFISVINQLDAQHFCFTISLFHALHVSSTCAHHQEVKIALHSLWYHQTYRWQSGAQVEIGLQSSLNLCTRRPPIGVMIPKAV